MCTSGDGWKRLVRMYLFEMWQKRFLESTTEPAQMAFEWIGYGFFIDTAETLIWHHFIGPCCNCCCCCCSGCKMRFNMHFCNGHRWWHFNVCCFYCFSYATMMMPMVLDSYCIQFIRLHYRFGDNIKMLRTRLLVVVLLFMWCCIKCCLNYQRTVFNNLWNKEEISTNREQTDYLIVKSTLEFFDRISVLCADGFFLTNKHQFSSHNNMQKSFG